MSHGDENVYICIHVKSPDFGEESLDFAPPPCAVFPQGETKSIHIIKLKCCQY